MWVSLTDHVDPQPNSAPRTTSNPRGRYCANHSRVRVRLIIDCMLLFTKLSLYRVLPLKYKREILLSSNRDWLLNMSRHASGVSTGRFRDSEKQTREGLR